MRSIVLVVILFSFCYCKKIKTCKDDCEDVFIYNYAPCPSLLRMKSDTTTLYRITNWSELNEQFKTKDTVAVCVKFSHVKNRGFHAQCPDGNFTIELNCIDNE